MSASTSTIMINYHSRSYLLELIQDEHLDEAYDRLWKIIQHNPQSDYVYEKLVGVSKLWYYKHKYNCQYSKNNEYLIELF